MKEKFTSDILGSRTEVVIQAYVPAGLMKYKAICDMSRRGTLLLLLFSC